MSFIYNGQMFGEEKDIQENLKDTYSPLPNLPLVKGEEKGGGMSYSKTQKLITALYMVTDIIDKDEPIRHKLRTLGIEIISDIHNTPLARTVLASGVDQVMSFLDIAFTMSMISEMNKNILVKEFTQLKNSLVVRQDNPAWLEEFLAEHPLNSPHPNPLLVKERGNPNSKENARIGVQKAGNLMKAIKDMSDRSSDTKIDFEMLKKQRRFDIIKILKNSNGNATIKDIRTKINAGIEGSLPYGEKTLQRELVSMIKDGVLQKTGKKRWSRYFIR